MNTFHGLRQVLDLQLSELLESQEHYRIYLPEVETAAISPDLQELAEDCRIDASRAIEALTACRSADADAAHLAGRGEAMAAMVADCRRCVKAWPASATRDAALLACLRSFTYLNLSGFGTLLAFAECLGLKDVVRSALRMLRNAQQIERRIAKLAIGGWFEAGLCAEAVREPVSALE